MADCDGMTMLFCQLDQLIKLAIQRFVRLIIVEEHVTAAAFDPMFLRDGGNNTFAGGFAIDKVQPALGNHLDHPIHLFRQ